MKSKNAYKKQKIENQRIVSEMQKGLEEEQFEVWFQPQVNHANKGALIGAEALVRWKHPERGFIPPAVFIPLFEDNGLIYELDRYVWKHACASARKSLDAGLPSVPVSVNVSRYDILQKDFFETITSIIEEYHLSYDMVHLEVTESAFSDNTGQVSRIVNELIARGFIIAIDDFGCGYSSLSLLRNVPAHIIKLDLQFFADGENQTRNECIIESVIRMAKMLGMAVIAEGVEQLEQAELLRSLGCAYVQGYLYSKPLPYDEFVEYETTAVGEKINRGVEEALVEDDSDAHETQKLFRNIIAGTEEVVVVFDNNTKQLLYANRAAEQYYGKRFDPINPTTCMEYCNHWDRCGDCPAKGMKSNERREFSTTEKGKRLKTLYAQMEWNGHDAVGYYQTDISELIKAEEHLDYVLQSIPAAITIYEITKTGANRIFISDYAQKVLMLADDCHEKRAVLDLYSRVHEDDRAQVKAITQECFKDGKPFSIQFRIVSEVGVVRWVQIDSKPIEDTGKEDSILFYSIYTDITELKQIETSSNA